jgi:2'-5' RNA ligase
LDDPRSGVGASLWLVPEEPARARLATWIDRLAARLGTPSFPPHVTLLSGLDAPETEVLAACPELAGSLSPLSIRLDGVEGAEAHFRCLYVRAEADDALKAAHARAARQFGREPDPSFDPHLSLVYGTLAPDVKAGLARELERSIRRSIDVRRLHVWRTEGAIDAWAEIGAFDLVAPVL